MTSEDHLDSLDSESPNTTPRGQKKTAFQGKLPGLVSRHSPFYVNSKKEYGQIPSGAISGRSIASNNHEISEAQRLYERSSTLEKKGFDFAPDTEQWSATHRQRTGDQEKDEKDNFTFHEKDDDEEVGKKEVEITIGDKLKKPKKEKKKTFKEKGADSETPGKADKPKKKRKKSFDSEGVPSKKNSEDIDLGSSEGKSTEGDKKIAENKKVSKKRKSRRSKSKPKEDHEEEKKSDSDSSQSHKKKNKEMNFRQMMAIKQQNLSISEQHPIAHGADGFIMTESLSFVGSPQSLLALTKQESCPSPMALGPQAEKLKVQKKEKSKKKDKKKKYEVESTDGDKPKKSKEKKNKEKGSHRHHHHHKNQPKRILLSDGLNLVKLMTDRTNCKKTKLLIILYTFTVLWSIVLNGLEFAFFTDTGCKPFTEVGTAYFCFILMILLKFIGISVFNLELTFKQPYKSTVGFLYPLLIQCFCPLLQMPQNVYDFAECQDANHVVKIRESWKYLQAIIGSIIGITLYFMIKQKIDLTVLKSRLGRLVNKFVKCIVLLVALGWNVTFFVIFCAQKNAFLPSLFFDFYLYLVLVISAGIYYGAKKKMGLDELKKVFIKDEKKLSEPLSPPSPVKEMIKIEVQP